MGRSALFEADIVGGNPPLTIGWTFTSPTGVSTTRFGAAVSFVPAEVGQYDLSLSVTDLDGDIDQLADTFMVQPAADRGGDTFDAATLLKVVRPESRVSDFVGVGDAQDYYRFTLTGDRKVTLTLTGMAAGNYGIRVYQVGDANTSYSLTLTII